MTIAEFRAGHPGFTLNDTRQHRPQVIEVMPEGQAEYLMVEVGWKLIKVDDELYNSERFITSTERDQPYVLTFLTSEGHQSHPQLNVSRFEGQERVHPIRPLSRGASPSVPTTANFTQSERRRSRSPKRDRRIAPFEVPEWAGGMNPIYPWLLPISFIEYERLGVEDKFAECRKLILQHIADITKVDPVN